MASRKRLLINPRFQLTFLGYFLGTALTLCGIFFAAERYFFWNLERNGAQLGLPADHVFFEFIRSQRSMMDGIFFVTAWSSMLVLSIFGLYLSNRIAGPLYRLKKYFTGHGPGGGLGTVQLRFRKGDYFQDLAEAVNDYFKKQR